LTAVEVLTSAATSRRVARFDKILRLTVTGDRVASGKLSLTDNGAVVHRISLNRGRKSLDSWTSIIIGVHARL